jgi:hypothetical protein
MKRQQKQRVGIQIFALETQFVKVRLKVWFGVFSVKFFCFLTFEENILGDAW